MTWQFNPYAIPLFISALPLVLIVYVAWRRRANPAARMFVGFTGGALGLVLAYAMELLSADLSSMMFWLRFEYLFHWGLVFWPLFALAYSGYDTSITRPRILALFIVPTLILTLVWTNDLHSLIYTTSSTRLVGSVMLIDRSYGVAFWVWMAYLFILFVAGYFILLRKAFRTPQYFQGQIGWLALAMLLPAVGLVLTQLKLTPIPLLDLTPYCIALACFPLAISLFRFRLFDLIPAAYELVIESMGDAVIVCDAEYRIVQVNSAAAQLMGKMASKLLGCPVEQVLSEITDFKLDQRAFDLAGAHEIVNLQAAASERAFDLRISPLRNHQGVFTGQVFVLREITDRKQAEQQALDLVIERERVHILETFIQDTSHDFRTPISVILTSAYLLARLGENAHERITSVNRTPTPGQPDSSSGDMQEIGDAIAKMRNKAQGIQVSAARLEKLVESMLEVTELERANQFEFAPHELNPLVSECVQAYRAAAARKQLGLEFEPDSALSPIRMDEWKLRRALQQLLDNAIQYTPEGGAIRINTYSSADEVVIQLCDTGIGISDADLPRIFEPLYRADRARSDTTGGAGLGLSIARRIVEAHAGRIEVESVVGKGSTFRLYLPLGSKSPL